MQSVIADISRNNHRWVRHNDQPSELFKVKYSVRQDCVISPIFLIVIDWIKWQVTKDRRTDRTKPEDWVGGIYSCTVDPWTHKYTKEKLQQSREWSLDSRIKDRSLQENDIKSELKDQPTGSSK